jgi:Zn-dependent protease with chaperone function
LTWADLRLHRLAHRLDARQFTRLAAEPLGRRSTTAPRLITLAAAALLLAGVLAVACLGAWLLVAESGIMSNAFGAFLLGVAFVLRPRLGHLAPLTDRADVVERTSAPELFGLVERIAAEVGAPMPHVLLIGRTLNAFTTTVGLRRRRVLCLGLPLWATLGPQERVALVGHELGHFVNGDVRRGPLTRVATRVDDRGEPVRHYTLVL